MTRAEIAKLPRGTWTHEQKLDIVEALKAQGIETERAMIRLPQGPLKMVGDHDVAVALHSDVVVSITVSVLGDTA